eukprot:SM004795S16654  [mRNA]  locus=s4795:452:1014:+ [translate_table: standard]
MGARRGSPRVAACAGQVASPQAAVRAPHHRFPTFPEAHRFGSSGSNRRPGMGCHHPKLLLLRRRDCLRVVVTSANLTASQVRRRSFTTDAMPTYAAAASLQLDAAAIAVAAAALVGSG